MKRLLILFLTIGPYALRAPKFYRAKDGTYGLFNDYGKMIVLPMYQDTKGDFV